MFVEKFGNSTNPEEEINCDYPTIIHKEFYNDVEEASAIAIELAYLLYDRSLGLYLGNHDLYISNAYKDVSIKKLNLNITYSLTKIDFESVEIIARKVMTLFGYPENSEMYNGLEFGNYFEEMVRNYQRACKVYNISVNDDLYILPVNNLNIEYKDGTNRSSFESFAAGLSLGVGLNKEESKGSLESLDTSTNAENKLYEDFLIQMLDGQGWDKSNRPDYINTSGTLKDIMSWMKLRKDKVCQFIDVDGTNCIRMLDDNTYKYKVYFIIERITEMISNNDIYAIDFGTRQIMRLISSISLYDTHDSLLINKMISEMEITYEESTSLLKESMSDELLAMLNDKESYTELFRNTIQFIFGYARKICVAFNYDKKELSRLVRHRWIVAKPIHEYAYTNK